MTPSENGMGVITSTNRPNGVEKTTCFNNSVEKNYYAANLFHSRAKFSVYKPESGSHRILTTSIAKIARVRLCVNMSNHEQVVYI